MPGDVIIYKIFIEYCVKKLLKVYRKMLQSEYKVYTSAIPSTKATYPIVKSHIIVPAKYAKSLRIL